MNPSDKTPRDWLLARHESATAQLDTVRRAALPPATLTWQQCFQEIFRPHRKSWRALVAIWLVLLGFHFVVDRSAPARPAVPPSPEALVAWFAQLKSYETFAQIAHRP